MSNTNNSTKIDKIRNTLLANGYIPLPAKGKRILIKGWTSAEIDHHWVAENGKFPNTGLRCDNLIAFDVDITDQHLADEAEGIIENRCGNTDLCRFGNGWKRLLLYRRRDQDELWSGRTPAFGGHMVELLTSRKRQFICDGIHPGTKAPYEWVDASPLTVAWASLPELDAQTALACMAELQTFLENTGLPQTSKSKQHGDLFDELDDLTDDFRIQLIGGEETTWGALKDTLDKRGVMGNILREDGEFGDSGAVHFLRALGSNERIAYDFTRDCRHSEPTITDQFDGLESEPADELFEADLQALLDTYCILKNGQMHMIDSPEIKFDINRFKQGAQDKTVMRKVGNSKPKLVSAVDVWLHHPKAIRADLPALRPDHPDKAIIRENGVTYFNLYNPPLHPETGGEIDTVMEFINHLIPRKQDREIFLDWIAHKVSYPGDRMHGLIMVTEGYGTGRGTWVQIMSRLFGPQYVNSIELHDMLGTRGQSQYNHQFADSLVLEVPEALEEREGESRYKAREIAYERLKVLCEPQPGKMLIKRKTVANTQETIYASLFICTNHTDAFVVPESDRRLIVIENTNQPLAHASNDLLERIHTWKLDPANIGALFRWFQARAQSRHYDAFGMPPMTNAKRTMIDSSYSDMDRLWDMFVDTAKGDLITSGQWHRFVNHYYLDSEFDLPQKNLKGAIKVVLAEKARRSLDKNLRVYVDGIQYRPWIIRRFDEWADFSQDKDKADIAAEIKKNGDPTTPNLDFLL